MTASAARDEPASGASAAWLSVPKEARAYQGHRAGVVSRTLAASVDLGVVIVWIAVGYGAWAAAVFLWRPVNFTFPSPPPISMLVIGAGVMIVYLTIAWTTTGRSYGSHLMGLRVVNYNGRHMRLSGAFVRAACCTLFPIGLFWVVLSEENRSLQDVVLRTSVIYDWQMRLPEGH